ncbi:hypothetical protein K4K53_004349 [Colletotrichum sp. SAR 10_77]|nr:hypothetical protein K4K53_004349 [Colletotrichum sp. SAR 10_77]
MARIRKDKCVDISTLRKTSTATCLLELFEGVNTKRGEIRQHNLNSSKGSEVRLLFQSSDHLAYLMVRDHEIISIWPVMNKEGDFMGNKMRPLHSLTISANPERPSRQNKEGRVSPVQVNTLTNMKLTKNLVETLSRPNGIGEFMSTQYDINRKKRWRMTHAQHCHNVFLLFKRVRSFSEDLSARKSAIQVLNDYVVAMSFGRIFMRKESGFTDRNFGDILKMTVSQLEHKYASSTSTEKLASIDEIPPVRGGTSPESRNNLTREEITIADPEHHALLKAILDLSPESTWDTSALNPANVDAAPGEPGGRSVAYYNRKGRKDFQGVCKALFEGIETSAEALNYAIEQPNIQAKEIFDAVRHFQLLQPTGGDPGNPTGPTQTGIDENPRHRSWAVTLDVWAGSLCRQVDAVRALTVKETDFDEFYNRVLRDVPLTFLETTFSFDDKANLLSYQTYLQGHRRKDGSLYTQAEQQAIMKEIQNLEVKRKMKTPRKGNLHAESITFVMHCIAVLWDEIVDESHTPSQDEDILDLPDKDLCFDFKNLPLILAVSKRCCPTCHHLLKICVERVKGTSLTYSGNHSDWWPVALPPWMPKDIAERLHSRIHADLTDRFEAILYPDRLPKTAKGSSVRLNL